MISYSQLSQLIALHNLTNPTRGTYLNLIGGVFTLSIFFLFFFQTHGLVFLSFHSVFFSFFPILSSIHGFVFFFSSSFFLTRGLVFFLFILFFCFVLFLGVGQHVVLYFFPFLLFFCFFFNTWSCIFLYLPSFLFFQDMVLYPSLPSVPLYFFFLFFFQHLLLYLSPSVFTFLLLPCVFLFFAFLLLFFTSTLLLFHVLIFINLFIYFDMVISPFFLPLFLIKPTSCLHYIS